MTTINAAHPVGRAHMPNIRRATLAFALALAFSLYFAFALGQNLGLFFAGFILATLIAPPLAVAEHRAAVIGSIVLAIAIVWLWPVQSGAITFAEWSRAAVVLLVYTFAISALAALFIRGHIPPAAVTLIALAWLSWPIWLAPALHGASAESTVAKLVAANPTFAIQGTLSHSFPVAWAQYRIAYQLTNIGDDISYQMPSSILPCVILHGLIGIIAWLAAHWGLAARGRQEHPPVDQSPRST